MKKKELAKEKNGGFTLVELLVAVCILIIVVVPLLHAFVTSSVTNRKARIKLEATTVAENAMEKIKSESILNLESDADEMHKSAGKEELLFKNETLNSRTYDVKAILDPTVYQDAAADPDAPKKYNTNPVVEGFDMDDETNAFYIQPTDMDKKIANETYPGYSWNFSGGTPSAEKNETYIYNHMKREIRVIVDKFHQVKRVRISIAYEYTYHNGGTLETKTVRPVVEQKIYEGENKDKKLNNIYLFYEPLYNSAGKTSPNETVVIENADLIPVTVNIIKQNKTVLNADDTGDMPEDPKNNSYGIAVNVVEPGRTYEEGKYVTQIRSNLVKKNQLNLHYGENESSLSHTDQISISGKFVKLIDLLNVQDIVRKKNTDHIYEVTVKVFNKGESAHGQELVSITGTKE